MNLHLKTFSLHNHQGEKGRATPFSPSASTPHFSAMPSGKCSPAKLTAHAGFNLFNLDLNNQLLNERSECRKSGSYLWYHVGLKRREITRLSSRFWSASLPVLSRISTFLGWEMSLCRSMTLPPAALRPLHADSASKSSVFASEEPSTGQNTPQNFCLGLLGLSEPTLWKKGGTSPAVDIFFDYFFLPAQSEPLLFSFFFSFGPVFLQLDSRRLQPVPERRWSHCDKRKTAPGQ